MIRAVPHSDDPAKKMAPRRRIATAAKIRPSLFGDKAIAHYTGWNEPKKRGVALASQFERSNPKEAEIAAADDGTWRLFFKYAADNASKIGVAKAGGAEDRGIGTEFLRTTRGI